jgi:predicted RNase H-like HicB family nuclease/DNA-binding XRE family transcriptional regulator
MKDITGYFARLKTDPESGTIGVSFPDHPNIVTFGYDREHALEMAEEALNAALESEFDRNLPLPKPTKKLKAGKGEEVVFILLAAEVRTAFLIRSWREAAGLSQRQMAKRLAISTQAYQRMERPGRSNLTVSTLTRVASVLNKEFIMDAR